jgi:hypothetical protein
MIAQQDIELFDWVFCLATQYPMQSGGFLESVGRCAVRADAENYVILRPVLLQLKAKYPQYDLKPEHGNTSTAATE